MCENYTENLKCNAEEENPTKTLKISSVMLKKRVIENMYASVMSLSIFM